MNIAILGGGVEGKAVKLYFESRGDHAQIFDNFTDTDIPNFQLGDFDLVFRSPSVHPQYLLTDYAGPTWTSSTNYFFENCPAPIIGVTGTKGKGTTCSLIKSILDQIVKSSEWKSRTVHLVGNIGSPAISSLESISPDDIVIYELSSFQLWDLRTSPQVAVILRIEPDHLDRHPDFEDYLKAKSNIVKFQTSSDSCIYYRNNEFSTAIANNSQAQKIPYPPDLDLTEFYDCLQIPGEHNHENAAAAITAVAAFLRQDTATFIQTHTTAIKLGLSSFKGLPHRLEFVRNLNGVDYYDDNYSSAFPALDVAVQAFLDRPTILIAGGKDRHLDLTATKDRLRTAKNLQKVILIGETKTILSQNEDPAKFMLADSLAEAVKLARNFAEQFDNAVVLMSPGAASFDMFENFSDRGEKFQAIVHDMV